MGCRGEPPSYSLGSQTRQESREVRNIRENSRLKTENSLLDFEQKNNRIISKEK